VADILLIDDDKSLTSLLSQYLQNDGFNVTVFNSGEAGLQYCLSHAIDILILDVMMPDLDGISLLRQLRQQSAVPVIMLTARGDDIDKVLGLEQGADDYVAKPCLPRELSARIKAILRRMQHQQPHTSLRCGPVELSPSRRQVFCYGELVQLTGAEFSILLQLMSQAGTIVSKEDLSRQALGKALMPFDRSIDVHISNIRQKLHHPSGESCRIESVRGQGYLFISGTAA